MNEFKMPEWLTDTDEYEAVKDHDAFVDKSILSIVKILSKIKFSQRQNTYKINSTVRFLFVLLLLVMVSLADNTAFIIITAVYLLVLLCMESAEVIIHVLRFSIGATLFSFLIMLPAALMGNGYSISVFLIKIFIAVSMLVLNVSEQSFNQISGSLKAFHVPDMFIMVLDITIKYIEILGNLALNMLHALKLRSVGKNRGKYKSLSGVAGTMFLSSRKMADEMYDAMICRCFSGAYYKETDNKLHVLDFIYIIWNVVLIALFIYLCYIV